MELKGSLPDLFRRLFDLMTADEEIMKVLRLLWCNEEFRARSIADGERCGVDVEEVMKALLKKTT